MRIVAILVCLALCGCTYSNDYGECIGVTEDKSPELIYKPSVRNAIWSVVFSGTIAPPIVWLVAAFQCPVGRKVIK